MILTHNSDASNLLRRFSFKSRKGSAMARSCDRSVMSLKTKLSNSRITDTTTEADDPVSLFCPRLTTQVSDSGLKRKV